jgi:hypothetical protein
MSMHRDPLIIGLTGRAGSGKDASADHLCATYGFVRASFAAALKDMAAHLLDTAGVDYAHLTERSLKELPIADLHGVSARLIMQTLGDWGRNLHPDWWITVMERHLGLTGGASAAPVHDRIVISDVRFPNEATWLAQRGGWLLRLQREQATAVAPHISEAHADTLPAAYTLPNHGPTLVGLHGLLDATMYDLGIERAECVEMWG